MVDPTYVGRSRDLEPYPSGGGRHATGSADGDGSAAVVRVVLRPIATPLSLGFLGLAGASLPLSALQLGWVPQSQKPAVALVLMTFTALLQLVATVYGFLTRDAVAATGMGVLTGTWLATGVVMYTGGAATKTSPGLAFLLFAAATALLVPVLVGLRTKGLAALVMLTAALRFGFTGAYQQGASATWRSFAGWTGIALFGLAVLAAFAFELEDSLRRVLPVTMRRGRGREALAEGLSGEVRGVQNEAGVREQL